MLLDHYFLAIDDVDASLRIVQTHTLQVVDFVVLRVGTKAIHGSVEERSNLGELEPTQFGSATLEVESEANGSSVSAEGEFVIHWLSVAGGQLVVGDRSDDIGRTEVLTVLGHHHLDVEVAVAGELQQEAEFGNELFGGIFAEVESGRSLSKAVFYHLVEFWRPTGAGIATGVGEFLDKYQMLLGRKVKCDKLQ